MTLRWAPWSSVLWTWTTSSLFFCSSTASSLIGASRYFKRKIEMSYSLWLFACHLVCPFSLLLQWYCRYWKCRPSTNSEKGYFFIVFVMFQGHRQCARRGPVFLSFLDMKSMHLLWRSLKTWVSSKTASYSDSYSLALSEGSDSVWKTQVVPRALQWVPNIWVQVLKWQGSPARNRQSPAS